VLIPQKHAANPELANVAKLICANWFYFYRTVKHRLALLSRNAWITGVWQTFVLAVHVCDLKNDTIYFIMITNIYFLW